MDKQLYAVSWEGPEEAFAMDFAVMEASHEHFDEKHRQAFEVAQARQDCEQSFDEYRAEPDGCVQELNWYPYGLVTGNGKYYKLLPIETDGSGKPLIANN